MGRGDVDATLADVIAAVADGKGLGCSDGSERLALLWVTEYDNSRNLCGVGSGSLLCRVVDELSTLGVAGQHDLRVRATGRSLQYDQFR